MNRSWCVNNWVLFVIIFILILCFYELSLFRIISVYLKCLTVTATAAVWPAQRTLRPSALHVGHWEEVGIQFRKTGVYKPAYYVYIPMEMQRCGSSPFWTEKNGSGLRAEFKSVKDMKKSLKSKCFTWKKLVILHELYQKK